MIPIPLRKCRVAIKIVIAIALILITVAWMRYYSVKLQSSKHLKDSSSSKDTRPVDREAAMFESELQQAQARIVSGLGAGGRAVDLVGDGRIYRLMKESSEQKYAMNAYLSDRIPYVRNLTDYRHPLCDNVTYDARLPSASVVIVFRSQPLSVLLRTVWSVLASLRRDLPWYRPRDAATVGYDGQDPSSPYVYLKELILVDDNSKLAELKGKLGYYVRTRLPPDLVKIIRHTSSTGVAGARLAGARAARGEALVFLDAHCEVQRDWLRPLLQRVKDRPHSLVMPILDTIEPDTFEYKVKDGDDIQVGGFTFGGENTWIQISDRELARRGPCAVTPTRSPVLHNGPFAVARRQFWTMGGYDDGMTGWGADNLEISFRFWMCGGTVEVVPCARVGQVYFQYGPHTHSLKYDYAGYNTARMAEVWMDDYKELFYLVRPDLRRNTAIGSVSHRRVMRTRLHCHGFGWYLQHVFPEKFVPVRDSFGFVRFSNAQSGQCLDTLQREAARAPLGLHPCHGALTPSQLLVISLKGELRDEVRCADIYEYEEGDIAGFVTKTKRRQVLMTDCQYRRSNGRWQYISGQLRHEPSGLCLDAGGARADAPTAAVAAPCRRGAAQAWRADVLFVPGKGPELTKAQVASLLRIRDASTGPAPAPPRPRLYPTWGRRSTMNVDYV